MTQDVISQLKSSGKVVRGWLGIGIQPLTEELSAKFGAKEGEGVLVNEVFEGDPAAKAGVEPGDIITKVAGQEVTTPSTLARVIAGVTPGKKIDIDVIRNHKHMILTAVLAVRKEEATLASIPPLQEGKLGLNVQELSKELAEKFKVKEGSGLLITKVDPESPAATSGLKEGDLISEINREKVATVQDFNRILEKSKKEGDLLFRIIHENRGLFLVVKPKEK
jgi:serine protease Do